MGVKGNIAMETDVFSLKKEGGRSADENHSRGNPHSGLMV